jgi:hypothetical protein
MTSAMLRASLAICLLAALAAGCDFPAAQNPAKARAANEFNCDYNEIELTERPDLSPRTVDVNACGHAARYTCGRGACTREPMDEPVE